MRAFSSIAFIVAAAFAASSATAAPQNLRGLQTNQQGGSGGLPIAEASWSLAQDMPLKEGEGKKEQEAVAMAEPTNKVEEEHHVRGLQTNQQGGSGGLSLAGASWSLAQDMPLKEGEGKKEQEAVAMAEPTNKVEEEHHLRALQTNQQGGSGGLPIAEASWSLAQDMPLKEGEGKKEQAAVAVAEPTNKMEDGHH